MLGVTKPGRGAVGERQRVLPKSLQTHFLQVPRLGVLAPTRKPLPLVSVPSGVLWEGAAPLYRGAARRVGTASVRDGLCGSGCQISPALRLLWAGESVGAQAPGLAPAPVLGRPRGETYCPESHSSAPELDLASHCHSLVVTRLETAAGSLPGNLEWHPRVSQARCGLGRLGWRAGGGRRQALELSVANLV